MNFHFNRYLKRKLYEIYLQSVIFFFPVYLFEMDVKLDVKKWKKTPQEKNSLRSAKRCIRLTWRHSKDSQSGLLSFSSFNISVFILSFSENLFFFSFLLKCREKKEKYIHKIYCRGIYCIMMSIKSKVLFLREKFTKFVDSIYELWSQTRRVNKQFFSIMEKLSMLATKSVW